MIRKAYNTEIYLTAFDANSDFQILGELYGI
jgi:hypothetical protein